MIKNPIKTTEQLEWILNVRKPTRLCRRSDITMGGTLGIHCQNCGSMSRRRFNFRHSPQ